MTPDALGWAEANVRTRRCLARYPRTCDLLRRAVWDLTCSFVPAVVAVTINLSPAGSKPILYVYAMIEGKSTHEAHNAVFLALMRETVSDRDASPIPADTPLVTPCYPPRRLCDKSVREAEHV